MTDKSEPRFEKRSTSIKIPITPRRIPRLIRLGWALRKADKGQDLDADSPCIVMFDEHSSAIFKSALSLAAEERKDPAAVAELVGMGKRHKRALRVAALGARQRGAHRESSPYNLAHRLLQAAITDSPVKPVKRDEQERLDLLDEFQELPGPRRGARSPSASRAWPSWTQKRTPESSGDAT
jgi:hypothetical protein